MVAIILCFHQSIKQVELLSSFVVLRTTFFETTNQMKQLFIVGATFVCAQAIRITLSWTCELLLYSLL